MNFQELQEAKQTFRIHSLEKEFKDVCKCREKFVRRFNPDKIKSMSIDEYVIGRQNKESFCYIIERTLDKLGRITGVSSGKFGVWYSPEEHSYNFRSKFGTNYKEAFNNIKKSILELLEAGKKHDCDAIVENPLHSFLKGKILSVYYPEDYLNIFSEPHLDYYLTFFNLDTKDLKKSNVLYKREALLDFKNMDKDMRTWSVNMFAVFLWSHYPKTPLNPREVAVKQKEKELEFPTIDSYSFVNMHLLKEKQSFCSKTHTDKSLPDYEKEARVCKKLGDRGEYVVKLAEEDRLVKEMGLSKSKAKKLVKWVSRESDSYGYDIKSVSNDETERFIEVKATKGKVGSLDFYYTENEYETAKKYGENYYIYVVFEILTPNPKIWVVKNPFMEANRICMTPVKYKVRFSAE